MFGVAEIFDSFKWFALYGGVILIFILKGKVYSLPLIKVNVLFFAFFCTQILALVFYNEDPFGLLLKISTMYIIVFLGFNLRKFESQSETINFIYLFFLFSVFITVISLFLYPVGVFGDRLAGFFDNANSLAGISTLSSVFCLWTCLVTSNRKTRIVFGLFLLISVIVVLMTKSRAGLLSLGVVSLYVLYKGGALKASLIMFIMILFYSVANLYLTEIFVVRDINFDNRVDLFSNQFHTFLQSPIFGYGLGESSEYVILAESSYMSLLASSGIVGSLIFISIPMFLFISSLKSKDSRKVLSSISLLTILSLSATEAYLVGIGNPISILYFTLLGYMSGEDY